MNKKVILQLLLFLCFTVSAQTNIKGIVLEKDTKQPLEFAEVILIAKKSSNIKGTITDEKGNFQLNPSIGSYNLQIIYVGKVLYDISLEVTNELIDLGIIEVVNSQKLDEITITAKKRLIQRKVDRLVFNVENSIQASQGNATDLLAITPSINVQNNAITMLGKSDMAVMINESLVQLSGEELVNYLKSLRSEDIKNIEVFSIPPAKYEALGSSGIININLKKSKKDSWSASIGGNYLQRVYPSASLMSSFNYNKNKLSVTSSLNYDKGSWFTDQENYTFFPDELWNRKSPYRAKYERYHGRFGVNYDLTSKWTIGAQYGFNNSMYLLDENSSTAISETANNQLVRSLRSQVDTDQDRLIHTINLNNTYAIDTLGKRVSLNLDYFTFNNSDDISYTGNSTIFSPNTESFYAGINTNTQKIKNISGKLDIDYPTKWIDLDFGLKVTESKTSNDIFSFNSGIVDDPVLSFPLERNNFDYDENVQAVYISGTKKINKFWQAKLGFRLELTQTETFTQNTNSSTENDYEKLFPTFYVSYKPNDNATYSFSYGKRINRPQFYFLNPNSYFTSPFQVREGNPFLQPAFIDNFEFNFTYKKLNSKLYFSQEQDVFAQIHIPDENTNLTRLTVANYIDTKRFGLSESYTFSPFSWWESSTFFDLNYVIFDSDINITEEENTGFNSRISTYNDFNLNKEKTLRCNVNYWYNFANVDGIYNNRAISSLSFAIQYLLLNKNLDISLRANDIFKTQYFDYESRVNGIFQRERYYDDAQSLQLSITYKFGNNNISVATKETGNEEEKRRTGN
ncbi:TonB-dependent receptor domain-containing protein [Kordia sp. SMS9]|uniref:TonB-dependent receptor domain-containing protein n=1 Tax=Kordia sp. SMS9 TaxID=2282170 RepID=UPI000E0D6C70|nr:TonB-dependent receptor [Kordia sp. SMS9]